MVCCLMRARPFLSTPLPKLKFFKLRALKKTTMRHLLLMPSKPPIYRDPSGQTPLAELPSQSIPAWINRRAEELKAGAANGTASDQPLVERTTPCSPSPLLTIAEAAAYLRVSTRTVRRLVARGDISAAHIGRSVRIRWADIEALVAGSKVQRLSHLCICRY